MELQFLCSTPHVSVYFDAANNWLFIEWEGDVTLADVQLGCLEIAHCFLNKKYARILNSNLRITSVTPDIAGWLSRFFMPALELAGVQQLGWVLSPTLCGRNLVLDTLARCSHMGINTFEDVEGAVSWLQQNRPALPGSRTLRLAGPSGRGHKMREHSNHMTQRISVILSSQETGAFALA